MRIKSIRIQNFRSFADQVIEIDDYTCLVGANGAGKSTVLAALNVFFREQSNSTDVNSLQDEDFHHKNTADPVRITVVFSGLSAAEQDALSDYARNGELVVSAEAVFDTATGRAPVKQFGSRMGMEAFRRYFEADKRGESANGLKAIYRDLRTAEPALPDVAVKDAMAGALRAFEQQNVARCVLIPSEDEFYGIRGTSRLRPFVQWVFIPAVKDATDEQAESKDTALGKLLARTVRTRVNFKDEMATIQAETQERYRNMVAASQVELDAISTSLTRRLAEWSHPDANVRVDWQHDLVKLAEPSARIAAGESGFVGNIARFGHGLQRSYLLAILQELATTGGDQEPTLIFGCEEPELYQHPPQARYLAQVLRLLSEGNAQVILATHSPYFVSGDRFENIRLIRKGDAGNSSSCGMTRMADLERRHATVTGGTPRQPTARMVEVNEMLRPSLNEMFFAHRVVLVEGSADVAHLMTWLALTNRLGEFRRRGIQVVSVDRKSNMLGPLLIAEQLGIPLYGVFDCDGACDPKYLQLHERDNRHLLEVLGGDPSIPFPAQTTISDRFACWPTDLDDVVTNEIESSLGAAPHQQIKDESELACGNAGSLRKNALFIQCYLERAQQRGAAIPTLDALCEAILSDRW